jgi:hypothetical protein
MSSPTPEPVVCTSSYGTPSPSKNDNDEWLPPRPVAHGAAVAADAASPREHTFLVKRTLGVSHSSSATSAPPVRRRNGKRQKTAAAREDLCCFCSVTGSCTSRNCPCAKAGRPCHSCDPGECNRCTNTVEALNRVICGENYRRTSGIAARFQQHVGRALDPPLPLLGCLGEGLLGWLASWRVGRFVGWLTIWRVGRFLGWLASRSLVGRVGGGSRGLQLLATTVSSSLSSSERM